MKIKLFLFITLLHLVACGDMTNFDNEYIVENQEVGSRFSDTSFDFAEITKPDEWAKFTCLEEMIKACQIPDQIISNLSTQKLLEVCMQYPLVNNYIFYNDQFVGIDNVVKYFNGFTELFKRLDAAETVIDYYYNIDIDSVTSYKDKKLHKTGISPLEVDALELIMYSNYIPNLFSSNNIHKLELAVNKVRAGKLRNSEIFSTMSVSKSELLKFGILFNTGELTKEQKDQIDFYFSHNANLNFNLSSTSSVNGNSVLATSSTEGVIYTRGGKQVKVIYNDEFSKTDIKDYDDLVKSSFPNAQFISSTSNRYNCHSFAWHLTNAWNERNVSTLCWINAKVTNTNDNISKFWTNDYYTQVYDLDDYIKVFYYNSDHSAVKLSSQVYESKWGKGPVMRHAPDYGPYLNMSQRYYYTTTSPEFRHSFSTSSDYTYIGSNVDMSGVFKCTRKGYTATLRLVSEKTGEEVDETMATITRHSNLSFSTVFKRNGIYYLIMDVFDPSGIKLTTYLDYTQILVEP